jgi:hypothetical protein
MATTTNYGWTTPDDTALVKDGASAIRSLGTSVDTTTKALNPSTTLGDVEYRSSTANTNTRLGIGSTGQILTVTGGVPVWATPAGGGGMTLLSTTSLSGTSTTVSSISGAYNDLYVYIQAATPASGNDAPKFLPNGAVTKLNVSQGAANANFTTGTFTDGPAGTGVQDFVFKITDYANSVYVKGMQVYGYYTWAGEPLNGGGYSAQTAAITSIEYATGGAGTWASGRILIYGVK